jgi:RES domain
MRGIDATSVPIRRVSWRPSYRLIPSRYPTVGLYDAIADPADLDVVFAIEALANPRIRDELGELTLVAKEERVSGPGATPVMAAFTHLNPEGSRFSDGSYGVYYAAHSLETAIAEVSHHRGVFLRRTDEPALDVDLRLITASVEAELHDLLVADVAAGAPNPFAAALDADDYGPSQSLGRRLRAAESWGIRYPSVRHAGGECVGILRPRALRHAKAAAHLALHWDGARITHWYEKRSPHAVND